MATASRLVWRHPLLRGSGGGLDDPLLPATDFSSTWQIWWGQVVARVGGRGLLGKPVYTAFGDTGLLASLDAPFGSILFGRASGGRWTVGSGTSRGSGCGALAVTFPTIWLASELPAESVATWGLVRLLRPFWLVWWCSNSRLEVPPGHFASFMVAFLGAMTIVCLVVLFGAFAAVILSPQLPIPVGWGPWNVLGFALVVAVSVMIWTRAHRGPVGEFSKLGHEAALWTKLGVVAVGISALG